MKDKFNQLEQDRKSLLDNLIIKGIKDKNVLNSILKIKRENFVNQEHLKRAYDDIALPILDGQTISQPYTVAFMLELLDCKTGLKVLEIGTGSGYVTSLLFDLGLDIYSIERSKILFDIAKKRLEELGINCKLKLGDGTEGWSEFSPYDRIIISAASPKFPYYLENQLNNDAVVICPVGDLNTQTMIKGVYRNNKFELTEYDTFKFVPLIGINAWDV